MLTVTVRVVRTSVAPVWSIDELTELSRAVVTGRVVDVAVGRDLATDGIYTYVTVSVGDVLKGDIPERVITLKQLGGELGADGLHVTDQATFTIGEDVLLFLESRPRDGTLYTTALWQGKWTIERDTTSGVQVATRYAPDVLARGAFRGAPEAEPMNAVSDRVRAIGAGAAPEVNRGFVASPSAEELASVLRAPTRLRPTFALMSGTYRWTEFDTRTPIGVDTMVGGQPGLGAGGASQITNAFGLWTAATPLVFFGAGSTNRCRGGGNQADGHISIVYMDPCGEMDDSGGTLAIGGAAYWAGGGGTISGVIFNRASAGYVVNNNSVAALEFLKNPACFQALETHELGHVLGLGHSADPSAMMYAKLSSACMAAPARGLGSDDIAGIRSIYPASAAPSPGPTSGVPGAPTGFTTSAIGVFVTMTWRPPTTGGAATGYMIESGSAPGLSNIARFSNGSSAPSFSADKVGLGTYYVRVRATNAAGEGPPSNESVLVVGGGPSPNFALPGAPRGLTTKAVGVFVTITWQAPATGGAPTTYIIESGSAPGLSDIATIPTGSTVTSFSADKVGVGTYYVRIRAANSAGVGPPSNESKLVVSW